jgi:hypothetical protein
MDWNNKIQRVLLFGHLSPDCILSTLPRDIFSTLLKTMVGWDSYDSAFTYLTKTFPIRLKKEFNISFVDTFDVDRLLRQRLLLPICLTNTPVMPDVLALSMHHLEIHTAELKKEKEMIYPLCWKLKDKEGKGSKHLISCTTGFGISLHTNNVATLKIVPKIPQRDVVHGNTCECDPSSCEESKPEGEYYYCNKTSPKFEWPPTSSFEFYSPLVFEDIMFDYIKHIRFYHQNTQLSSLLKPEKPDFSFPDEEKLSIDVLGSPLNWIQGTLSKLNTKSDLPLIPQNYFPRGCPDCGDQYTKYNHYEYYPLYVRRLKRKFGKKFWPLCRPCWARMWETCHECGIALTDAPIYWESTAVKDCGDHECNDCFKINLLRKQRKRKAKELMNQEHASKRKADWATNQEHVPSKKFKIDEEE